MSDELIYAALAAVMADCDHVAKRDKNTHQGFMFRGIDAVVNAVGPVLRKHKVVVVPDVEIVTYDVVQTSTGKPATACRVVVAYHFIATDGSRVTAKAAGEAWDSGDKATPKAMSVAFRTALLQALTLPTDEPDPDASTYERVEPDWQLICDNAEMMTRLEDVRALWKREKIENAPKDVQDRIKAHAKALESESA